MNYSTFLTIYLDERIVLPWFFLPTWTYKHWEKKESKNDIFQRLGCHAWSNSRLSWAPVLPWYRTPISDFLVVEKNVALSFLVVIFVFAWIVRSLLSRRPAQHVRFAEKKLNHISESTTDLKLEGSLLFQLFCKRLPHRVQYKRMFWFYVCKRLTQYQVKFSDTFSTMVKFACLKI